MPIRPQRTTLERLEHLEDLAEESQALLMTLIQNLVTKPSTKITNIPDGEEVTGQFTLRDSGSFNVLVGHRLWEKLKTPAMTALGAAISLLGRLMYDAIVHVKK